MYKSVLDLSNIELPLFQISKVEKRSALRRRFGKVSGGTSAGLRPRTRDRPEGLRSRSYGTYGLEGLFVGASAIYRAYGLEGWVVGASAVYGAYDLEGLFVDASAVYGA